MANVIAVSNETNSSIVRITKDGRKLCYEMKVLQQPQRARACGSGAKCTLNSTFPADLIVAVTVLTEVTSFC